MIGKRSDNNISQPGDYGKIGDTWYAMTPNGLLGNLTEHEVTEHEDGTITVSPSILVTLDYKGQQWHGYLHHGVWNEA